MVMRASDIAGLSAAQIKDKFALRQVPTYVTDVNIPAGQTMRASTANGILGNGGGGVQFEVVSKPAKPEDFEKWFKNARPLP